MEIYFDQVNYCTKNIFLNRLLGGCIEKNPTQTTQIDFSSFRSLDNFNGIGFLTATCIQSGNEKQQFWRALEKCKSFVIY